MLNNDNGVRPHSLGSDPIKFFICVLLFVICSSAYAFNLDKVKTYFLKGEYNLAIAEGEKVLARNTHGAGSDELYYILGMSYLKQGNYLRASDIFEIILKEFRNSALKDEAQIGLGDSYFLRGDYQKAKLSYAALLNSNTYPELQPLIYYRLSQCAFKEGDIKEGNSYLNKLKRDFPRCLEIVLNRGLENPLDFYTVQIGSFVSFANAERLRNKLLNKGYDAYLQEADMDGKRIYRVRVGKLKSRSEAVRTQNKLSREGYPTHIFP